MEDRFEFQGTDRFEITRRLGEGGMGVVYEAFDRLRETTVALKTFNQIDANAIYRMKQEFRALIDVVHPNLVKLHELVSAQDRWFFTMELVNGVSFLDHVRASERINHVSSGESATYLRRTFDTEVNIGDGTWSRAGAGLFSEERTAETDVEDLEDRSSANAVPRPEPDRPPASPIRDTLPNPELPNLERLRDDIKQLADGMLALHEAGKLHRDIKPSNVLVTNEGRLVLLDFGLATELYEEQLVRSTVHGLVCGTIAYMSPEQGSGDALTPASDWYSVGVMLYEALTGRLPFEGKPFKILLDKQRLDAPEPRRLTADVPDDLNALCVELLHRDPENRPTGEEVLDRLGFLEESSSSGAWLIPAKGPSFIGRVAHLERLERSLRTTKTGRAASLFMYGPSGMGKTALVRHFVDTIISRDDALVLGGRCYERELVPYKALDTFVDSLCRYLRRLPDEEAAQCVPPDLKLLARIFPVLERVKVLEPDTGEQSLESPMPFELRRQAFRALRDLLRQIAEKRSLVIVLDDLQWGDADSGRLLASLMRPPNPPPLLLLAGYRKGHRGRQQGALIDVLERSLTFRSAREMHVEQIEVGPLTQDEAETLALSSLSKAFKREGEPQNVTHLALEEVKVRAEEIARESGGSPLFVQELASYAFQTGNSTHREETPVRELRLEQAVLERLDKLPTAARRFLELVAVAAGPISHVLAKRATGLQPTDYQECSILQRHRFVRTQTIAGEELVEIFHDRIREVIVGSLTAEVMREHHLSLARQLEQTASLDPEALVYHLRGAGEERRAGEYALAAARKAADALAFDRAATLYKLCVELAEYSSTLRFDLFGRMGDALSRAGRGVESAEAYLAGAEDAPPARALDLRRRAAQQLLINGYLDRGLEILRQVLEQVGLRYPESAASALRSVKMQMAVSHLRGYHFEPRSIHDIPLADLQRIDVCWSVVTGLAMTDSVRAMYFHQKMFRFAQAAGEPYRMIQSLAGEVTMLGGLEQKAGRSQKALEKLEELASKVDKPHVRGLVVFCKGFFSYMRGNWSVAEGYLDESIRIHTEQCTNVGWEIDTARYLALEAVVFRGMISELPERVHAYLADAESRRNLKTSTSLHTSRAANMLWIALDETEMARNNVVEAIAAWNQDAFLLEHQHALVSQTNFDLYDGRPEDAWRRIDSEWGALEASGLLRLSLVRFISLETRARAALAFASASKNQEGRAKVKQTIRSIEAMDFNWTSAMGAFFRAQVALLKKNEERAYFLFREAEAGLREAEMFLHAAVAQRRMGMLRGGEEGSALVDQADRFLSTQSVRHPGRFADLFAPVT